MPETEQIKLSLLSTGIGHDRRNRRWPLGDAVSKPKEVVSVVILKNDGEK